MGKREPGSRVAMFCSNEGKKKEKKEGKEGGRKTKREDRTRVKRWDISKRGRWEHEVTRIIRKGWK